MEVGRVGERIAGLMVHRDGGKVLFRNFRAPRGGEVDIVCRDGKTLAFVEVKTRTSDVHARPIDAVNRDKQALIKRGANEWLRLISEQVDDVCYRYDVVEVILRDGEVPYVNWVKNAFFE